MARTEAGVLIYFNKGLITLDFNNIVIIINPWSSFKALHLFKYRPFLSLYCIIEKYKIEGIYK